MSTCEGCGKTLTVKWLEKTDGEPLCRDCYSPQVVCDDCGEKLARNKTVTCGVLDGKKKTLCRKCMLKGERPIEVMLVRSNWAPWDEHEVIPLGDLLYPECVRRSRRVQEQAAVVVPPPDTKEEAS
jgi:hypothetical protein